MTSKRQVAKRRVAVVLASTLGLSIGAGVYVAGSAFAEPSPAAMEAYQTPLVPGTPCTITAKSCVDLESQRAWLFDNGKIIRGPVRISSGGNGKETPVGHSLRVYRKEKDHKSQESRLPNGQPSPMPYSVFFEDGGIAFHAGDPNRSSAGCIRLSMADAQAWFNYLQIGDQVQVVKASEEFAARKAVAEGKTPEIPDSEKDKRSDDRARGDDNTDDSANRDGDQDDRDEDD